MERRFSYGYRKGKALFELVFASIFCSFLVFWLSTAFSIFSFSTEHFGKGVSDFPPVFSIMSVIPLLMFIFGLWIWLTSLGKLLLPLALVEGDDQYLYLRPALWQKVALAWDSVESLRYEQSFSSYSQQSRVYSHFYVYIKAQGHKTVKLNIGDMDGEVDDLVADLKASQPNIAIRGLS